MWCESFMCHCCSNHLTVQSFCRNCVELMLASCSTSHTSCTAACYISHVKATCIAAITTAITYYCLQGRRPSLTTVTELILPATDSTSNSNSNNRHGRDSPQHATSAQPFHKQAFQQPLQQPSSPHQSQWRAAQRAQQHRQHRQQQQQQQQSAPQQHLQQQQQQQHFDSGDAVAGSDSAAADNSSSSR
jgi:type IV secretory pathway VirB10-like protein